MSDMPSMTRASWTGTTAAIFAGSEGTDGTGASPDAEAETAAAGSGGRAGRRSGFVAGAGDSVAGAACSGAMGRVAGQAAEVAAESAGTDGAGGDGVGDANAARCCSGSRKGEGDGTGAGVGRFIVAKGAPIETAATATAAAAAATTACPSLVGFARFGLDPPRDLTGATVSSMVGFGMTMSGMVDDGTVENWRYGSTASGTVTGLYLSLARRRGFDGGLHWPMDC